MQLPLRLVKQTALFSCTLCIAYRRKYSKCSEYIWYEILHLSNEFSVQSKLEENHDNRTENHHSA